MSNVIGSWKESTTLKISVSPKTLETTRKVKKTVKFGSYVGTN